ncbi:MAG: ParB N-terminal domain-containing protein [Alphaproteobacteria bacterium]|nr:ParB N-terminal domain-containing protein [Alphaproteobacteria bacterium]
MAKIIEKVAPPSRLAIAYLPIDTLQLDENNARQHSPRQISQIVRSIQSFDFNVPILIDKNHKVLAGHGRILACQKMGWHEVPTIQLEHLTQEQARAFAIADNRLTENSTWNEQILAESLKELSLLELDFSLEATGFTMGEIDLKIESLSFIQETDPIDNFLPTIERPVTQPGDLWILGTHRLFCGNALEAKSYQILLEDRMADMVFTDPPYNVPIQGHVSGKGRVKHREFMMASGEMHEEDFKNFLTLSLNLIASNSKDGSIHYICMDWRHVFELITASRSAYAELKNICVWAKSNGGMGSLYRSQHEFVFVFKRGNKPHTNNIQLGKYGRNRTNVWEYPGMNTLGSSDIEKNLLSLHPTVKPVAMVADAIMDCSSRNDLILDPFLGSGSTLVAAECVGRFCYGMDIDPVYIDTAIRRWQQQTGKEAIHAFTGVNFNYGTKS